MHFPINSSENRGLHYSRINFDCVTVCRLWVFAIIRIRWREIIGNLENEFNAIGVKEIEISLLI